ncbi:MAG: phosphomethylpyrimidine synthase ThiC [Verrucomicrobia bacterium]|nr:phosphomethylpyrimidine synthase ThiC [Verrucomicrobiota bacterium]
MSNGLRAGSIADGNDKNASRTGHRSAELKVQGELTERARKHRVQVT